MKHCESCKHKPTAYALLLVAAIKALFNIYLCDVTTNMAVTRKQ